MINKPSLITKPQGEKPRPSKCNMVIVKKVDELDGLENCFGLKLKYDKELNRVFIVEEDGRIYINTTKEESLNVAKKVGFKFEIKKRTREEIIEEIYKECSDVLNGEYVNTLHIRSDGRYFTRGNSRSFPIGCNVFLTEEQAKRFCEELNDLTDE